LVTNEAAVGVRVDADDPVETLLYPQVLGGREDAGHVVAERLVADRQYRDQQHQLQDARERTVH
jgi:hypothetical protein